ncbi:MAG: hydrogenase nickel incorporation protein HypB [Eubacteriales bacterium]|jgi:hydrogenase nickel incorporation protein HypB|nr:hydrogenase nickel incorporation protein HypB [Desulforudis sp.]MBV1734895.1 hydrogenase nickel incorporation protein HypB [Desulforudis sp.]MBV1770165.1 hydrogenase nickel incorporation protein HypB [Desulforudis sp.]MDZ4043269.1 hydrogenase nickel incorporation protein HypB [Eubacteriales bacterium]MDZ7611102.1 hydrogenase nickel incorporation protein HypB [Eubacteriales bacterium]
MAQRILRANDQVARDNRERLQGLTTVNLISSPGAGKTTLLEKTIAALKGEVVISVVEGDIYTTRDAERIAGQGADVVQINTEGLCHLDANMVGRALDQLDLAATDLVVIENVGNLVCPAEFDLGEDYKVAVLSVTEGGDKPAKYPLVFRQSHAAVINKSDLIPYTDFNLETVTEEIMTINPDLEIFVISARTGEGLEKWCAWLRDRVREKKS